MNILLIQPQYKKSERSYPLGLGYLSSALKRENHRVWGADLSFVSTQEVMRVIEIEEIDLIGISTLSYNLNNALRFIKEIKSRYSILVVLGGPHATVMREQLFEISKEVVDFIIIGEGEMTICELVSALEGGKGLSQIPGIIWKKGKDIVINKERELINNLDSLHFPDRDIFPILKYKGMISKNRDYTQIVTSRGCPHKCFYCPEPFLWSYCRKRSAENIVDEIQEISEKYGIKEFHFEDANLISGDINRIKILCSEMIRRKLKVDWQCTNGIPLREMNDPSVIDLMAEAGCYHIALGVESFHGGTALSVAREQLVVSVSDIVKRCKDTRTEVSCYLIIGFPGQTLDQINDDIRKAKMLAFDFVQYSIFHLIPGSKSYEIYHNEYLLDDTINMHVSVSPFKFSTLKKIQRLAYFSLCFNPSVIKYAIKRLFHTRNILAIINKFYGYVLGKHLNY